VIDLIPRRRIWVQKGKRLDLNQQRELARTIFHRALRTSTVEAAAGRSLRKEGETLWLQDATYDLRQYRAATVVALGKAAAPLFDAIRPLLPANMPVRSVVSAPSPPRRLHSRDLYFTGGHPQPNADSQDAARTALRLLREADEATLVLFLISGGASSMCELPVDDRISPGDVSAVHRLLVGCGAPIAEINAVRKHLSAVKGGRLAQACGAATAISLLVSDVPENTLDTLGSGPSLPDSTTVDDCLEVIRTYDLQASLPGSVRALLDDGIAETPKPGDPIFANKQAFVLLDNAFLLNRATEAAQQLDYTVVIDNTCDDWDYAHAAKFLVERLRTLAQTNPKICLLSGGELTVRLPVGHGTGGRNQQFVLECAAHHDLTGITVLSAGSDGIDGNSIAAGAVADASTITRALDLGHQAETYLSRFDAGTFFAALDDGIVTGPTGNNLRDLRILLWKDYGSD
jgi:glycerate 2-kinase